jgi:hypothetical protein
LPSGCGQHVVVLVVLVVVVVVVVVVVLVVVVVVPTQGVRHRWHASPVPSSVGVRQGHCGGHPSTVST